MRGKIIVLITALIISFPACAQEKLPRDFKTRDMIIQKLTPAQLYCNDRHVKIIRVIFLDEGYTEDYIEDRLNVWVDDYGTIVKTTCG